MQRGLNSTRVPYHAEPYLTHAPTGHTPQVPPHCIPIHANVTTYDWSRLYDSCQFDVVMMDPPWQLATANPTRGVALSYSQLTDADITALPVPKLQVGGSCGSFGVYYCIVVCIVVIL